MEDSPASRTPTEAGADPSGRVNSRVPPLPAGDSGAAVPALEKVGTAYVFHATSNHRRRLPVCSPAGSGGYSTALKMVRSASYSQQA
jgi:hypothetical protein